MMVTKLIKKANVVFPDPVRHRIIMSKNMRDFISSLLEKDPKSRLGYNSKYEVLDHPWFSTINFQKLLKKQLKSPYLPSI